MSLVLSKRNKHLLNGPYRNKPNQTKTKFRNNNYKEFLVMIFLRYNKINKCMSEYTKYVVTQVNGWVDR